MAQSGSPTQGDIQNKHQLTDVIVSGVNTTTALVSGTLVYINGATGLVVVPTSSQPDNSKIRFLEAGVDNSAGAAITDKEAETFKKNARVIGKAQGAIVVGNAVRASLTNAGEFLTLADLTTSDTVIVVAGYIRARLGIYLGHNGEIEETANEPSDAADTDLVVIQFD